MRESFTEFFALGIIVLFVLCVIIYGPMFILGGLMYLAGA